MKILSKGAFLDPKDPWWVGKTVRCGECGFMAELDAGDTVSIVQERHAGGMRVVAIDCPTCKRRVVYAERNGSIR